MQSNSRSADEQQEHRLHHRRPGGEAPKDDDVIDAEVVGEQNKRQVCRGSPNPQLIRTPLNSLRPSNGRLAWRNARAAI
jgi:hypothetical protein